MAVKLHNIPEAVTEGKVTNVVIERGLSRCVIGRIRNSNIIEVRITPNITREKKIYISMISVDEFWDVITNLDLEEIEFEESV